MNTDNVKNNVQEIAVASATAQTQLKSPINFGNQGVHLSSLEDAYRFANAVVASGFAPRGMEKPESVLIAIQLGAELGITPMASLQNIAVINGRPSIYGDAALALIRASGKLADYVEEEIGEYSPDNDKYGYRVTASRIDSNGMEQTTEAFTIADAKKAKLWGKTGPWTDYPKRMLKFRARGFVLRDLFGDVLKGLKTFEEVKDTPEPINVTPLNDKISTGLSSQI